MTSTLVTTSISGAGASETEALKRLRTTVNEVVGSVFFAPMLRSLRNSSLTGTFGHGGRGEEVFQAQLDQILAERAGKGARNSLSQTIVDRFARAAAAQAKADERDEPARQD